MTEQDKAATMSDAELLARVASVICEETCGLTSACKSREAAKALLDKGLLRKTYSGNLAGAAPDLLEAISELADYYSTDLGSDFGNEAERMRNAYAAIAKAKSV